MHTLCIQKKPRQGSTGIRKAYLGSVTFTFSHLADMFIWSDFRIELSTLVLTYYCSTGSATEIQIWSKWRNTVAIGDGLWNNWFLSTGMIAVKSTEEVWSHTFSGQHLHCMANETYFKDYTRQSVKMERVQQLDPMASPLIQYTGRDRRQAIT